MWFEKWTSFLNKVLSASFHSTSIHTSKFLEYSRSISKVLEVKLWIENNESCGRIEKVVEHICPVVEPWYIYVPSCGTHMSRRRNMSQVVEHICPVCPKLWNIFVPFVPSCGSIISSYFQVPFIYFKYISSCTMFISSDIHLFQVWNIHFKLFFNISFFIWEGRCKIQHYLAANTHARSLHLRKIRKSSGEKFWKVVFYFGFVFIFHIELSITSISLS